MRKVLLALAIVALIAMPAMASVQNVKVSGDIEFTYLNRQGFDLQEAATTYEQSALIMQTRLRVDADLTDKVMATIALINEREWGQDPGASSDVSLNLAYVTMKEMLYSPLTVTIGRQNFAFGNSFVIDSAGTNNSAPTDSGLVSIAGDLTKQTAQDAIRLNFDYNPLVIDVLWSKISQGIVKGTIEKDDTDLVGINAAYQFNDERSTVMEGYLWYKHANTATVGLGRKADTVYMPGVRASLNVLDGWNLQGEFAYQFGTEAIAANNNANRKAYAAQILSNYSLPFEKTKKYEPVLGLEYTFYSGDSDPTATGGDYNQWDPMYENQAGGKIYNTLFNAYNSHTIGATLSMVPAEDVSTSLYVNRIWMDEKTSAFPLVQPDGSGGFLSGDNTSDKDLGDEVGVTVAYDYTEDVQFNARAGWFFPGDRFTTDESASQVLVGTKVAF